MHIEITLRITDPTELCIALFVIENLTTPYEIVHTVMRVRVHPFVLYGSFTKPSIFGLLKG